MGVQQSVTVRCDSCGGEVLNPPTFLLITPVVHGQQLGHVVGCGEDCAVAIVKQFCKTMQAQTAWEQQEGLPPEEVPE